MVIPGRRAAASPEPIFQRPVFMGSGPRPVGDPGMTGGEAHMRSLLFVPADSERKLARGLESGADALILDLEDSVAAANRPTARRLARDFLEAHRPVENPGRLLRYVRVNPLASGLALDDLGATVAGRPDGILLPKCLPEDVRTLDHYLSAFEAAAGARLGKIRIIAIATETPQAVFALGG